jgi:hypothetical protein
MVELQKNFCFAHSSSVFLKLWLFKPRWSYH